METDKDMTTMMSPHVRDRFKDEIPEFDKLIIEIQQMVRNPKSTLIEIQKMIPDHFIRYGVDIDPDIIDEKYLDAIAMAHYITIDLLLYLEVNETNYKRIRDYTYDYSVYEGFDVLIMNFRDIISEDERKQLIEDGKKRFFSAKTKHWVL